MLELIIIIIAFIFLFFLLNKKINSLKSDSSLINFSNQINQSLNQVAKEIGAMQEIGRDMKRLQDFFKTPKLRGNIGEQVLRDLLEQILPKGLLKFQHRFRNGQQVDAIIKTNQGIIPIDSKFPLAEFQPKDIKKHINDIAKKYIMPAEGTVDFAVMYVPSEKVYYDILIKHKDILDYGYNNKVYIVAPNNFYYFLKVIMLGLEGAKVEETARKILGGIKSITQESHKLSQEISVLDRHIINAKGASERVNRQFDKLTSQIQNIGQLSSSSQKSLTP